MPGSKVGRPTNEQLLAEGKIPVSKMCKICQSGAKDEITQMILNRSTGRQIMEKFGHLFSKGLTPTNIHSHKQHINVEVAVREDRKVMIKSVVEYNDTTKKLFQHRYDKHFDKMAAADVLYKQRLDNLLRLQHEVLQLNQLEEDNAGVLTDMDLGLRRKIIQDLEVAYRGFNQDLIKHIQLDSDLYTKQLSVQFVKRIELSILTFTQKFMDVIVKEINDDVIRERITEQLGDLLDAEIAPNLDPEKAIDTDVEIIESPLEKVTNG